MLGHFRWPNALAMLHTGSISRGPPHPRRRCPQAIPRNPTFCFATATSTIPRMAFQNPKMGTACRALLIAASGMFSSNGQDYPKPKIPGSQRHVVSSMTSYSSRGRDVMVGEVYQRKADTWLSHRQERAPHASHAQVVVTARCTSVVRQLFPIA